MLVQSSLYLDAIDELSALRAKMDSSDGGHAGNDWIEDDSIETVLLELEDGILADLNDLI